MDASLKAKWTAALRSGEYKQAEGFLRHVDWDSGVKGFCCIGVLGDIQGLDWDQRNGICNPSCDIGAAYNANIPYETRDRLAKMNDGSADGETRKHSFAEIADYIDANL